MVQCFSALNKTNLTLTVVGGGGGGGGGGQKKLGSIKMRTYANKGMKGSYQCERSHIIVFN